MFIYIGHERAGEPHGFLPVHSCLIYWHVGALVQRDVVVGGRECRILYDKESLVLRTRFHGYVP